MYYAENIFRNIYKNVSGMEHSRDVIYSSGTTAYTQLLNESVSETEMSDREMIKPYERPEIYINMGSADRTSVEYAARGISENAKLYKELTAGILPGEGEFTGRGLYSTVGSIGINEDELTYLQNAAGSETVNKYNTSEINVDMGGITNSITSDADIDSIMEYFEERLAEALSAAAEGTY